MCALYYEFLGQNTYLRSIVSNYVISDVFERRKRGVGLVALVCSIWKHMIFNSWWDFLNTMKSNKAAYSCLWYIVINAQIMLDKPIVIVRQNGRYMWSLLDFIRSDCVIETWNLDFADIVYKKASSAGRERMPERGRLYVVVEQRRRSSVWDGAYSEEGKNNILRGFLRLFRQARADEHYG